MSTGENVYAAMCDRSPAGSAATSAARKNEPECLKDVSRSDPAWDAAACEAFVDAYYERLFAWFCWLTGRRDAAADLTQATFAAFWESLGRQRVREPAIWLYRIARNQWRKFCRARRNPTETINDPRLPADPRPGPEQQIATQEFTRLVARLVGQLPPACREAVALRYWSDFSYKQIAKIQGVPAVLARWRVHRGRALLRAWLRRAEGRTEVCDE